MAAFVVIYSFWTIQPSWIVPNNAQKYPKVPQSAQIAQIAESAYKGPECPKALNSAQ